MFRIRQSRGFPGSPAPFGMSGNCRVRHVPVRPGIPAARGRLSLHPNPGTENSRIFGNSGMIQMVKKHGENFRILVILG